MFYIALLAGDSALFMACVAACLASLSYQTFTAGWRTRHSLVALQLGDITVFLCAGRGAIGSASSLSIFHVFICSQRLIRQLAAR